MALAARRLRHMSSLPSSPPFGARNGIYIIDLVCRWLEEKGGLVETFDEKLKIFDEYNAYFVELNRDMQIELIERTEHALGG